MDKINLEVAITKITNYLIKKQAWDYNYIKYSQIKKMISYITKIKKTYILRKIFLSMVDQEIFNKKKNNGVKSYLYKFKNPYNASIKSKETTITFT
tara:strand:+ start:1083 stop:1370 length:288 start_codon:yes stop_codon:yes gene_type:complete